MLGTSTSQKKRKPAAAVRVVKIAAAYISGNNSRPPRFRFIIFCFAVFATLSIRLHKARQLQGRPAVPAPIIGAQKHSPVSWTGECFTYTKSSSTSWVASSISLFSCGKPSSSNHSSSSRAVRTSYWRIFANRLCLIGLCRRPFCNYFFLNRKANLCKGVGYAVDNLYIAFGKHSTHSSRHVQRS